MVVFSSADPDFFIPHVDVTKIAEYREAAAKLTGEKSIGALFRRLSETNATAIAQIAGRVRGGGNEFVLACDMRFALRERAIFGQMEVGFGVSPGAGGLQHLARLMGRGRAREAVLSADDYDADTAERYGWINRALPDADLAPFVAKLARRIASFPREARSLIKSGSTPSRWRPKLSSAVTLICPVKALANLTPNAGLPSCSVAAYRPEAKRN